MNICRRAVLEAGVLELGDFQFADGSKANNHLSMEKLFQDKLRLEVILRQLGSAATRFEPELLVGIPRGGELLAEALASEYASVPIARISKTHDEPGKKIFDYRTPEDREMVLSVERLVLVEDVFSKLTSSRAALQLPDLAAGAQAVIGVWDRGPHPSRVGLAVPMEALVSEYIPKFLKETDEIYGWGVPAADQA